MVSPDDEVSVVFQDGYDMGFKDGYEDGVEDGFDRGFLAGLQVQDGK